MRPNSALSEPFSDLEPSAAIKPGPAGNGENSGRKKAKDGKVEVK